MLSGVSSSALLKVRAALESARLACPVTRDALMRVGVRSQRTAIERALASLDATGCSAVIDAVLAEREVQERPPPELVWTGPEGVRATARDTAIVLSQLFERARERVVLAGYSFLNAEKVLKPLHRAMAKHDVQTIMLVDVPQPKAGDPRGDAWAQAELGRFLERNWPFGAPYPELHCDRRALSPAPPWCSLHAKCVCIDGSKAFLSSANFTERGQERNLEAGVLIHDAPFAEQLERQWMSLIASRLTYRYRLGAGDPATDAEATSAEVADERVAAEAVATEEVMSEGATDVGRTNPAANASGDASSSAFEALYCYTREPEALAWLAGQGVPAPDETGIDAQVDDEVVANLEWRWLDRRVALLVEDTSPAANRTLQEAGWRTILSTGEPELRRLVDWLRE